MTPGAERRTGTQADVFFWQIVLQKVFLPGDQKFSGP